MADQVGNQSPGMQHGRHAVGIEHHQCSCPVRFGLVETKCQYCVCFKFFKRVDPNNEAVQV